MSPADILTLTRGTIPLLVSLPQAGTDTPPSIARRMTPAALLRADTGWHLPRLCAFAKAMGASTLVPRHSRYVIDRTLFALGAARRLTRRASAA
jgi:N-formylglutamate deformylase